jgi:outer membrane lipoprotein carrier protein
MTSRIRAAVAIVLWTQPFLDTSTQVKRFESTYRGARTLQVTFLERYSENGRITRAEAGVAYFRRPGKMRWEYGSPEKNLFLVDGKWAWFYVPADHTVTRVPAKQSTDWRTPLALLAGEVKLSRICLRVDLASAEKPDKDSDVVLSCPLKASTANAGHAAGNVAADTNRDMLLLEVTQDTSHLVRAVIREAGGVDIEFKFKDWQFDPPLPDSFFRFEVPPGVAIVNGELPSGDPRVDP